MADTWFRQSHALAPLAVVLAFAFLVSGCGSTGEGERRSQSLAGTFVELETVIVTDAGVEIPVRLAWDSGTDKGAVTIEVYHPTTAELLFRYHADQVGHVESVLDTLAKVKGEIAAKQNELGADVAAGLIDAIAGAVLPGAGVLVEPAAAP